MRDSSASSASPAPPSAWRALKRWAPLVWLAIAALAAWVLWQRLHAIDLDDVVMQLRTLAPATLTAGVACCFGSYALVGVYEIIAVRLASGRRQARYALLTAWIANPIGHMIGAAIVSGGALRYRRYAAVGLSSKQIGAIIALAAMPYVLSIMWLIDIALLCSIAQASKALRLPPAAIVALGVAGLGKDVAWLAVVALRREPLRIARLAIRLPGLKITLLQILFGASEVLLNATILYLFMPAELTIGAPAFLAIYLVALVAGQLSHVPAGIGVLEAALLLMLPQVPPAKLLGAVLAYRAVFELLPLAIALLLLAVYETMDPAGAVRKWLQRGRAAPE
jgi:uncharacterized membrane protein YbhN (UPF0104 family)